MATVTEWEYLDNNLNAKFQFRQNAIKGKPSQNYTIRYVSDNYKSNRGSGESLGTIHENFFEETKAMLHFIYNHTDSEEMFINGAISIFKKRRRFINKRIPRELETEIDKMNEEYVEEL